MNRAGTKLEALDRLSRVELGSPAGRWWPMPAWARFLTGLGAHIAQRYDAAGVTSRAAIILPTRRFATALIGAGIVLTRNILEPGVQGDVEAHFEELRSLEDGTPVTFRQGDRILKGYFRGFRTLPNGREVVGAQLEDESGGGLTHYMPPEKALNLHPHDDEVTSLPKNQKGKRLKGNLRLVTRLLPEAGDAFLRRARLDSVLIGKKRSLREELSALPLRVRDEGGRTQGTLQDLVRVREFGAGSNAYRTVWCSSSVDEGDVVEETTRLPIVVFNGAGELVRGSFAWPTAPWIAVLGRTEHALEEATETVTQCFFQVGGAPVTWSGPSVPDGVELFMFSDRSS